MPCPLLDGSENSTEPSFEIIAQNKHIYGHAHSFNIHSLSCFSDGETFLSADDPNQFMESRDRQEEFQCELDMYLIFRHFRYQTNQYG